MVYDPKIYNVEGIILKRSMMVMDWAHANSTLLQVRIQRLSPFSILS
jgi:hypothetical protein